MDWIELKYVRMISGRLNNYRERVSLGNTTINFSCPLCGDSHDNKKKARGYIYSKKNDRTRFYCHNCGESMSVAEFIGRIDSSLASEMKLESLRERGNRPKSREEIEFEEFVSKMKKPEFRKSGPLSTLKKVSQLDADDPIKKLVVSRLIPNQYHAKLFACQNFARFANEVVPGTFSDKAVRIGEPRLLIPFLDREGKMHAFQGRSLGPSSVKYITVVVDEETPKIYGLDTVDLTKRVYAFEGPIDSMFIPNGVATAGGSIIATPFGNDPKNTTVVYDNEPRNPDTVKKIDSAIMAGYSVCIWPDNMVHKDVNEMILAGLSPEFVRYVIDQNTRRDLAAKLALNAWKRV